MPLVTGDRILLSTDAAGRTAATALPRADGSQPLVQTRRSGKDLYVCPEGAVEALATGRADEGSSTSPASSGRATTTRTPRSCR
ncbi:hypothetical protein ACFWUZ_09525 [Streptomyces sp. NPDC058646]|uniref:hypothetical protein n=1 Tax=Streptomyces sp. NPDC058646 TaxID=3346574 RepID=UPI0036685316